MFKINFSKLPDLKPAFQTDATDMRAIALSATRRLVKDTTAGKSPDGGVFERYSPKYQLYRASKGRGGKPNMVFSGRMLRDFKPSQITANTATLEFLTVDSRAKAIFHHYGFTGTVKKTSKKGTSYTARVNLPARPFVQLSEENMAALLSLLASRMEKKR